MEDEVYSEEDLLSGESYDESVLPSSDDLSKINEKLDRVEALLNEEISLRYTTESGGNYDAGVFVSSSGVQYTDYSQYIYDLLNDGVIQVEVVDQGNIFDKQLNDYNVSESLELVTLVLGILIFIAFVINRYTPKRR